MRAAGIVVFLFGLALLGRSLFALAWDAGTSRVVEDRIFIAFAVVSIAGGVGMAFEQAWGWKVTAGVVVLGGAFAFFQAWIELSGPGKRILKLYELPDWSPRPEVPEKLPPREWARARGGDPQWRAAIADFEKRVASELSNEWWSTPIERLHELRRQNVSLARDWEIQGDDRARVIVLYDPYLPILSDRLFALNVFLLAPSDKGRIARAVIDGFYTADRDAPVELRLREDGDDLVAVVVARSEEECISKTFRLGRSGITPIENAPSACR